MLQSVKCRSPLLNAIVIFNFLNSQNLSYYIMARSCVCVAGYLHDANKEEKARKSNAKSPHEELENHKNIRFQLQCNGIVSLANNKKKSEEKAIVV